MFRAPLSTTARLGLSLIGALVFLGHAALPLAAAGPDDAIAAARNQLGVLEYCAGRGHIPAAAAERQKTIFERLPAPQDRGRVAAAYAKGQQGIIAAMGVEQPIAEAARLQNTDEAGLCRQTAARSGS